MVLLGIRRAIGLAPNLSKLFPQYLRRSGIIFLIFLILLLIGYSGELLKLLYPGMKAPMPILGNIVYSVLCFAMQGFTIPLMITKGDGLLAALKQTGSILYHNALLLIICSLLMGVILAISSIPLGIGLFWTLPMAMVMMGLLFRNTTGLTQQK